MLIIDSADDSVGCVDTDVVHAGTKKWKAALVVGTTIYGVPQEAPCILARDSAVGGNPHGITTSGIWAPVSGQTGWTGW